MNKIDKTLKAPIKIIGIGDGGSKAVRFMFEQNAFADTDYIVYDTDKARLAKNPVPHKILLDKEVHEAAKDKELPEYLKRDLVASLEEVLNEDTELVFVVAAMGGNVGAKVAPTIAKVSKEHGILTAGIVSMPLKSEGETVWAVAKNALESFRKCPNSFYVIDEDVITEETSKATDEGKATTFTQMNEEIYKKIRYVINHISGEVSLIQEIVSKQKKGCVTFIAKGQGAGGNRAEDAITATLAMARETIENNFKGTKSLNDTKDLDVLLSSGTKHPITEDEMVEMATLLREEVTNSKVSILFECRQRPLLSDKILATLVLSFKAN